ncbi:hypothetical protein [Sphingomonas morindae]|uniref:hypothetical protein n=1 Tax=Sphingomonas morindae TaxID=1541170 RepID=UPI00349E97C0
MSPVGEQRGWRHLKMNAWGETPTLALADGSFLSETSAIARYLDDTFDGRRSWARRPTSAAWTRCGTIACGCTSSIPSSRRSTSCTKISARSSN